jgi:hypothetical protein
MKRLITEKELRQQWGLAGRKRVAERNWERAAELFWEGHPFGTDTSVSNGKATDFR